MSLEPPSCSNAYTCCKMQCNTLQHSANHTATHCKTLQHTATHCNTLTPTSFSLEVFLKHQSLDTPLPICYPHSLQVDPFPTDNKSLHKRSIIEICRFLCRHLRQTEKSVAVTLRLWPVCPDPHPCLFVLFAAKLQDA